MEEKKGNTEEMFKPIKKNDPTPDIHFYLNWKCSKCGMKYGTQPEYCHSCLCNNLIQINPEYQSLMR